MTDLALILFDDARAVAIGSLAALADRPEPYAAGVHLGGTYEHDGGPFVSVPSAQVTSSAPHVEYVSVRVIAWHDTPGDAHDLAQLARAVLLADPALAAVPLTGPAVELDPDSGRPMAAFTVRLAVVGRAA